MDDYIRRFDAIDSINDDSMIRNMDKPKSSIDTERKEERK